jgi:FHS family L-fucose permease-like MFS transporter
MSQNGFNQFRLAPYAGPGHWNDPDMLEVGNGGMSATEYRTHFSLWCLLAAPLMAGNDLRTMSAETRDILTNREVIAVDQDALGKQAGRILKRDGIEVWARPLQNGSQAIGIFNRSDAASAVKLSWGDCGLAAKPAGLRDLWLHQDVAPAADGWSGEVPSHGVILLIAKIAKGGADRALNGQDQYSEVLDGARLRAIDSRLPSLPVTPSFTSGSDPSTAGRTYRGPFAAMTVLFFMWGFMTVFNDILIPRFKDAFALNYFQAMLVQFAFFGAYFVGSLIYFILSAATGDPIARMGYKNGIVIGLLISAVGSAIFWPAAQATSYPLFLLGLFVVGLGFAMLQIAANPYVTILGPERTASSRLNLAQGFNSVGTTIGPLVGGYLIFQYFAHTGANGAQSVKVPYLAFCIVFTVLACVFYFIHLPHIGEGKAEFGLGALKYPHVLLGILAIFMYVGGEVSVGSAIINFLKQPGIAGFSAATASQYVSIYWGGLLIGRFMGAVELSDLDGGRKRLILAGIPVLALAVLCAVKGLEMLWCYGPLLVLCWGLFQLGRSEAGRTLGLFATAVVGLLAVAMMTGGKVAMWCVLGVGLFTSIGWSNSFSLAIEGVGIFKSQASSLLVMAILGGAILPPVQGYLADHAGLRLSFAAPLAAYAYVAFYGWKGHMAGRTSQS